MNKLNWKQYSFEKCDFPKNFWQSIDVWILKPHVLNKKVGAVEVFHVGKFDELGLNNFCKYIKDSLYTLSALTFKDSLQFSIQKFKELQEDFQSGTALEHEVSLRLLYPRTGGVSVKNIEVLVKDLHSNRVTFIKPIEEVSNLLPVTFPYSITCGNGNLSLLVLPDALENEQLKWLSKTLLPKLVSWMKPDLAKTPKYSNQLIAADKYLTVYNEIKQKYFKSIQEIWTESTDPQKFIIEDVAIASYLLVLWEGKCQRFVDLGCGNGLLVHILNSENHSGVGLDIRARKIWNSFPKTTILKEFTILPSLNCKFSDVDWIIGNHSDELTPWIPVIAAKSDYRTNFFLLPCCLFDFNGNKYARSYSNKTCYEEYMDYVEHICQMCGFNVAKDRLKIPSTKRSCFIGKGRIYSERLMTDYNMKIDDFVNGKMNGNIEVKIRSSKEKVRNCTQLDKEFLEEIVKKVANYIISTTKDVKDWKEGEFIDLKDVIELLSPDTRQKLKDECGGIQTLLKNHHHLFLVVNGKVKLRKPMKKHVQSHFLKKKECWFFKHHPDSCPLSDSECSYIHNHG